LPKSPAIEIPLVSSGQINIDGVPDDALWKKALGIAMDENKVPEWHFFGSHIVFGNQLNEEGATFWMIATSKGLALLAHIDKGG
jgi:hypothetical protein